MAKQVKKRRVLLRRFIQKLKLVDPNVGTGDGGFISDKIIDITTSKPQKDTTHVIKDTVVVKPMN